MSDENRAWKIQYMLRLPDGMRERIKASAQANNRSMNAEIVYRLETTFDMDDYAPKRNVHPDPEDDALKDVIDRLTRDLQELRRKLAEDEARDSD